MANRESKAAIIARTITKIIKEREALRELDGKASVRVSVGGGFAAVSIGAHETSGQVVSIHVGHDWIENVDAQGIAVVGDGLILAATPAAPQVTPEQAERCWLATRARVELIHAKTKGDGWFANADLGYVVQYAGLLGFHKDPHACIRMLGEAYARHLFPTDQQPSDLNAAGWAATEHSVESLLEMAKKFRESRG